MTTTPENSEKVDYDPVDVDVVVGYELEPVLKISAEEKREGLTAIDCLTQLHFLAKQKGRAIRLLNVLLKDCKAEQINEKQLYLDYTTHWYDTMVAIRIVFNKLMLQINSKPVFFARSSEHLLNLFKFCFRNVVVLLNDTDKSLLQKAQRLGLYGSEDPEPLDTIEDKKVEATVYGVPLIRFDPYVLTLSVTGFGDGINRGDMKSFLQKEFAKCGDILAISAPRSGITRAFITFYTNDACSKAMKLHKKKNSEGWIMNISAVKENEWWPKVSRIQNKSASSGSSGTQTRKVGRPRQPAGSDATTPTSSGESSGRGAVLSTVQK